jgi:polar amino acid transport system substrate-binding protein
MMLRRFGIILVLAAFGFVGSCAFAASALDKDVLTVGTEATYPPFEYYDDNNAITGFDVEMLALIGPKIGREIKFVDMAYDGLIPALTTGKIDMAAAAINATEERRKVVDFSDVYQVADASVVVKAGNKDSLSDLASLKGRAIGVQLGTTEDAYLTNSAIGADIRRYQKVDDAVNEVALGRIDGVLLDSPVAISYVGNEKFKGSIEISFKEMINGPEEGFSLAVRKGDAAFVEALNKALRELQDSGELDALKEKYGLK